MCICSLHTVRFLLVPQLALSSVCVVRMRPLLHSTLLIHIQKLLLYNNCFYRVSSRVCLSLCIRLFFFSFFHHHLRIEQKEKTKKKNVWPAYFKCWTIISNNTIKRGSWENEKICVSATVSQSARATATATAAAKSSLSDNSRTKTNLQCRLLTEEGMKQKKKIKSVAANVFLSFSFECEAKDARARAIAHSQM